MKHVFLARTNSVLMLLCDSVALSEEAPERVAPCIGDSAPSTCDTVHCSDDWANGVAERSRRSPSSSIGVRRSDRNMAAKIRMILLLLGVIAFSWPAMMLLHECGHLLAAWLTGGQVQQLVWHPLVFSRTDVSPNPAPLVVVWAGPIAGCLLPAIFVLIAARLACDLLYLTQLFCGFCLLANGIYIGIGSFDAIGDAGDMLRLGTPLWIMIVFGIIAMGLGFWQWHLASFKMGFGKASTIVPPWQHVWIAIAAGIGLNAIACVFGNTGV